MQLDIKEINWKSRVNRVNQEGDDHLVLRDLPESFNT